MVDIIDMIQVLKDKLETRFKTKPYPDLITIRHLTGYDVAMSLKYASPLFEDPATHFLTPCLFSRLFDVDENLIIGVFKGILSYKLSSLSDEQFREVLIQRRYLSYQFTPFYAEAIKSLGDEKARGVVARLLAEEYPLGKPSHREDLERDLEQVGITGEHLVAAPIEGSTKQAADKLISLARKEYKNKFVSDESLNVYILSALKVGGESLVSAEYDVYIPEMERRFGFKKETSVFYVPHWEHDMKGTGSHSEELDTLIKDKLRVLDNLIAAESGMVNAFDAKKYFYNQFREHKE